MISLDSSRRFIHRDPYGRIFDYSYTENAFVNADSYDFHQRVWNGKSPNAYVIHNAGFVVAIVFPEYFAYTEQDALDEAADSGKLDYLKVSESDLVDYISGYDSEDNPEYEGIIYLGNASEEFDSENLDLFTVPVTVFRDDPKILDIIAQSSREDALELIQDAKDAVLKSSSEDLNDLDAYYILRDAEDYLIKTL